MVSLKSVEKQLKSIKFNSRSWGKAEINELPNILLDDEKIFECVNGTYEGGFALLCATNIRLLLVDKKPLKFLTVEDLRFDMINQIDYSHRLMGARINVSAGNKNLRFTSFNQQRLRKLINHIQHRMAEVKKEQSSSAETQQQHLERINQQLQAYLMAQHQQQEELKRKLEESQRSGSPLPASPVMIEPVKPAPELADFLYAQSLMQQYQAANEASATAFASASATTSAPPQPILTEQSVPQIPGAIVDPSLVLTTTPEPVQQFGPINSYYNDETTSLIEEGRREIFGARAKAVVKPLQAPLNYLNGLEVHPIKIAYAKLPTLLQKRKFANPSILPAHPDTSPLMPTSGTQIAGV